mgnify:CR=1 FL=1
MSQEEFIDIFYPFDSLAFPSVCSPTMQELLREWEAMPPIPTTDWRPLEAAWKFALGEPQEGLNTSLQSLPPHREITEIPHRTLHPDTPYWYTSTVPLPAPCVLEIGADDGAQLYLDGIRIPMQGDTFLVAGEPRTVEMVVRVLNKAVYGGLEWVRVTEWESFERYTQAVTRRSRLSALVRKLRLLKEPTTAQISLVCTAIHNENETTLQAAWQSMAHLPLTLVSPLLLNTTSRSTTVLWETDVPCKGAVEWGRYAIDNVVESEGESTLHIVELEGLLPDTSYVYRVRSGSVVSPVYTFQALPEQGSFAFTYWSDAHCNEGTNANNATFRQTVNALRQVPSSFTVGGGDMVEDGNHLMPWLHFFESLAPLACRVPIWLMGGNHEYDRCFEDLHSVYLERYMKICPAPHYFAWSASNARFVALDPNLYFPTGIPEGSEEYEWFMQELESEEWREAEWHFVFIHQPPYSQGWLDYEGDIPIRDLLEPLIEKYRIDFVVSGHTHDYERLTKQYGNQTTHFLVLGGAGGGIEDGAMSPQPVMDRVLRRYHFGYFRVEESSVIFEAIATDMRVLDTLVVTKE